MPNRGERPVVSVVTVFHRDTAYLREAVASVRAQTLRDFELVLVDNGVGLAPADLGEAGADPRIEWVRFAQNRGIPAGHNAGVAAARAEFVALLDHDDLMLPTRLERQVAALRADADLGLVSSLVERIDARGAVTGREFALVDPGDQHRYTQFAAPVVTPAYSGRREVFAALPYRERFPLAADFDFLARAAERWRMAAVREVLLRYRWHAGQTTQVHAAAIEASLCRIRLATARRRRGRAEDLETLVPVRAGEAPGDDCRRVARQALADGCAPLAAYLARRSLAWGTSPPALVQAARLAVRAVAGARGGERRLAARLFLGGPVRALGVRPG